MPRSNLGSTRILFDVDASGGSGASSGGGTTEATPTPAVESTPAPATTTTPPKDDGASTRYQISREREMRIKAENERAELEKLLKTPKPVFDTETDPDGRNEIDYKIQQGIKEGLKSHVKELGLEDTLQKIQVEREQEEWFKGFDGVNNSLKSLGLEPPTRQELQAELETIDTKGISREQLSFLSKMKDIQARLKPQGFSPGNGGKPDSNRALSQDEINANIFKAFNM